MLPRHWLNYSIPSVDGTFSGGSFFHAVILPFPERDPAEAAKKSYFKVKFLLEQGIDPNIPDASGKTPLMRAVRFRQHNPIASIVKLLLQHPGLMIEKTDNEGRTAFSLAFRRGDFKMAWLVLSHSPIYRYRFLFGTGFLLTALTATAAGLLFFLYAAFITALVCASAAALFLLYTGYTFCALDAVSNKAPKSWSTPQITGAVLSGLGLFGAWLGAMTLWTTSFPWAWWLIGAGIGLIGIGITLAILSACCRKIFFRPDYRSDMQISSDKDPLRPSAHHFQRSLSTDIGYKARVSSEKTSAMVNRPYFKPSRE